MENNSRSRRGTRSTVISRLLMLLGIQVKYLRRVDISKAILSQRCSFDYSSARQVLYLL